jgi:hypothetical protein
MLPPELYTNGNDKMDKNSFFNGKKKNICKKRAAGNEKASNAVSDIKCGNRVMSEEPQMGSNIHISPMPESKKYSYGLNF